MKRNRKKLIFSAANTSIITKLFLMLGLQKEKALFFSYYLVFSNPQAHKSKVQGFCCSMHKVCKQFQVSYKCRSCLYKTDSGEKDGLTRIPLPGLNYFQPSISQNILRPVFHLLTAFLGTGFISLLRVVYGNHLQSPYQSRNNHHTWTRKLEV